MFGKQPRLESAFQKDIIGALRRVNAVVLNLHGHGFQAPGWPDLFVCHRRWAGWIELKVGRNTCSQLQAKRIRELQDRGVLAVVLREAGKNVNGFKLCGMSYVEAGLRLLEILEESINVQDS